MNNIDLYIKEWSQIVESLNMEERSQDQAQIKDEAPENSQIETFIENMSKEVTQELKESYGQDLEISQLKGQAYEILEKIKTKEDLQRFIEENRGKYEEIQKNNKISEKVKKYLKIIWEVLCKIVKFGLFCSRNITSLGILAAIIMICVKFEVGPIEACQKGFEVAKVIYQAADLTLTGAKKGVDIYQSTKNISEKVGDKVGEIIGKTFHQWL